MIQSPRWREPGNIRKTDQPPLAVKWPSDAKVEVSYQLLALPARHTLGSTTGIELEPNDTPEMAQPIVLSDSNQDIFHHLGKCR